MNVIIKKYNDLLDLEEKSKNGTLFTRLKNTFRRAFGFHEKIKIPKKVWKLRFDLSNTIEEFTAQIKTDKDLEKAFYAYQSAAKAANRPYYFNLKELELSISTIQHYGPKKLSFPSDTIDVPTLRNSIQSALEKEKSDFQYYSGELEKIDEKKSESYLSLSSKTKKLLEKYSEEDILRYAKDYYGYGKTPDDYSSYNQDLSPSSAAIILESILGRKNISWESIVDNYASILGKHNLENEKIDITKIVNNKVDSLREHITSMSQIEKDDESR